MSGFGTSPAHPRPFLLPSACIRLDFGLRASEAQHPGRATPAAQSTCPIAFRSALVRRRFHLHRLPRLYHHWVSSLTLGLTVGKAYQALCQGSVYQLPWSAIIPSSWVSTAQHRLLYLPIPNNLADKRANFNPVSGSSLAFMVSLALFNRLFEMSTPVERWAHVNLIIHRLLLIDVTSRVCRCNITSTTTRL
jgi:hypothetical protein